MGIPKKENGHPENDERDDEAEKIMSKKKKTVTKRESVHAAINKIVCSFVRFA